jgi:hypothetical protein
MLPVLVMLAIPLDMLDLAGPEIVSIEVDLLETNTVVDAEGRVRFTQVVAWEEAAGGQAIDRGYKVVKEGYPSVHPYGEGWRLVWWSSPDKLLVLTAREHLVTTTDHDPESRFRELGGTFRPRW